MSNLKNVFLAFSGEDKQMSSEMTRNLKKLIRKAKNEKEGEANSKWQKPDRFYASLVK